MADCENMVGGEWCETTLANFEMRCNRLLNEEQAKILPDNTLIAVLCDAVRVKREYCNQVSRLFTLRPEQVEAMRAWIKKTRGE